jgi:hypothetical protein
MMCCVQTDTFAFGIVLMELISDLGWVRRDVVCGLTLLSVQYSIVAMDSVQYRITDQLCRYNVTTEARNLAITKHNKTSKRHQQ